MKPKAIMNWSGGKDSSLCLYQVLQNNPYEEIRLLTTVNQAFRRISMHGVRIELLEQQARSLGFSLTQLALPETVSMDEYSTQIRNLLTQLHSEGFSDSIFGDIFLEDLRNYRETQLQQVAMKCVFPLWKKDSAYLIDQFIDLGFKAILVCVNDKHLDQSFAGRLIDKDLVKDLPRNVDICGENGEYHSFVFDGPIFKDPIAVEVGEIVHRTYKPVSANVADNCYKDSENDDCYTANTQNWDTGFYYCDLIPNT